MKVVGTDSRNTSVSVTSLPNFWVVIGNQSSYYVGHDESGRHRLEKHLRLCHLSFELLLLGESSCRVPPQLKDDTGRPGLGVQVEEASQPGESLPVVNLVPEHPCHDVVCQEGHDHHARPRRMSL